MKAVLRDSYKTVILLLTFLLCAGSAGAQTSTTRTRANQTQSVDASGKESDGAPLSEFEEELKAKQAIKLAEREHEENLGRAREIGEIGKALHADLKNNATLDREFLKKIERLEKLTKKVRGDAGGEDEEVKITNRPSDVSSAITQVADLSEKFSKDVQNTPRQVVSFSVINSANVLLELIKVLRTFAR
jgi:SepF-like predicted cell division protein (DUF552 family)